MKKSIAAVLGLTAACAACCAIPLAVPAFLAIAGLSSASLGEYSVALAVGAAAASVLGVALLQRARKRIVAKADCGCDQNPRVR